MSIAQYKTIARQLSTKGISTIKSALSNEVCNFVLARGAQKLSAKVEM